MSSGKAKLLIATALVFFCAVVASAQPYKTKTSPSSSTVWLGETLINIPSPEGFEEAVAQFEVVKKLFLATESPANELLFAHLPAGDCDVLRAGQMPRLTRYTKIAVLKDLRSQPFSDADMKAVVAEFRKNGTALLDPDSSLMKGVVENVEKQLAKLGSTKKPELGFTQTQNLGEFDVRPDVYSVMLFMTYKMEIAGTPSTTPVLASLTFLKLKDRLVYVTAYHAISSPEAVKTELKPGVVALKLFTTKWVNEILAANRETQ